MQIEANEKVKQLVEENHSLEQRAQQKLDETKAEMASDCANIFEKFQGMMDSNEKLEQEVLDKS